jgi:hypothetical protein
MQQPTESDSFSLPSNSGREVVQWTYQGSSAALLRVVASAPDWTQSNAEPSVVFARDVRLDRSEVARLVDHIEHWLDLPLPAQTCDRLDATFTIGVDLRIVFGARADLVNDRKPTVTIILLEASPREVRFFVDPSCLRQFSAGLRAWLACANDHLLQ